MRGLVVDASVLAAALLDAGPGGLWAESQLASGPLRAPHLAPVEASNVIRRAALTGRVAPAEAALAHRDLVLVDLELFPFASVAERVWALRSNLTAYDACYVALAEAIGCPLATLDERLAAAPGPACEIRTPPGG